MLIALALLALPAGAQAAPGDVYVADQSAGPGGTGAIFHVDLATGAATPLVMGAPLEDPADMTFARDGSLLVSDEVAAGVFRVDPATGATTEVARGGELTNPWGIAFGPDERLFVADAGFGSPAAVMFRINVTDNPGAKIQYSAGPPMVDPVGIARETPTQMLVTDLNGPGGAADGIVHRVNAAVRGEPVTEVAAGDPLVNPFGIAMDPAGTALIADANAFGGGGGLIALDPKTGALTPLASGPPYTEPVDVAPLPGSAVLVADFGQPGPGSLLSFDRKTGVTTPVASGPPFVDPSSVLVEPPVCRGQTATIVGSDGKDKLTGTHYPDVIAALGGNDKVKGDRGNDLVCAGDGRDFVNGGQGVDELGGEEGDDRLIGSDGPDLLDGGPGKDRCNGKASHRDRAVSCERRIKIP